MINVSRTHTTLPQPKSCYSHISAPRNIKLMMTDPLSITASVVSITAVAIGSVRFLYTTIGDIKDAPTALGNIRSDLQAAEPVLRKLHTELESEDFQVLLIDHIKGAVENCNSACLTFKNKLDHWMRHATKHEAFWAQWTDRVRVGLFEQETINVFKGRLNDCKSTLVVALSTSSVLTVTRQGSLMKEVHESVLQSNRVRLDQENERANRELAMIESSLKQLTISIRDEMNERSKRDLEQLLLEIREQKASNEVFRKTCEVALSVMKNVHDGIEQEIKDTKADNNSRAVAGLINNSGEMRNIKQKISGTSATGSSFAGAGILEGLELSVPSSKDK